MWISIILLNFKTLLNMSRVKNKRDTDWEAEGLSRI